MHACFCPQLGKHHHDCILNFVKWNGPSFFLRSKTGSPIPRPTGSRSKTGRPIPHPTGSQETFHQDPLLACNLSIYEGFLLGSSFSRQSCATLRTEHKCVSSIDARTLCRRARNMVMQNNHKLWKLRYYWLHSSRLPIGTSLASISF